MARYQPPDSAVQAAFRRQVARLATDEQDVIVGMEVVAEATGDSLGAVSAVVAGGFMTTLGGMRTFARGEIRIDPTGAVCAATLEARALAAIGGTVTRISNRAVAFSGATLLGGWSINLDLDRARLLVMAAKASVGL